MAAALYRTTPQRRQAIAAWLVLAATMACLVDAAEPFFFGPRSCPVACHCKLAQGHHTFITDCSDVGLVRLPTNISDTTTVLILRGNRIEEIDDNFFRNANLSYNIIMHLDLSNNRVKRIGSKAFDSLTSVRTLLMNENNITDIPIDLFRRTAELRVLDLTNNGMKAVRPGTFQKSLSKLESLNVSSNGLRVLSEGLFSNLSSLTTLILSGNDLQKVWRESFRGLGSLRLLDLSVNELHTIFDEAFWDLTNLKDLLLSANRLDHESFRPELFRELTGIQTLDLSVNQLRIITNRTFAAFPSLLTLMLPYNYIERIDPGAFQVQEALGVIDLTGNLNLKVLRRGVFTSNLRTLQYLSLSEMEGLERIEIGAFLHLNSLKYLFMEHVGNLTYWPDDFFTGLTDLEEFKMTNVPYVRKLPPLCGQKNLEYLFLPITGIEIVQDDLCAQAPALRQIEMSNCKLTRIPHLSGCQKLEQIHFSYNRLTWGGIEGKINHLPDLYDLTLDFNKINRITNDTFRGLTSLQRLFLKHNPIASISRGAFSSFLVLDYLDLRSTAFPELPTDGLDTLEIIKLTDNSVLKDFPPNDAFPRIHTLELHYAYHCCQWAPFSDVPTPSPRGVGVGVGDDAFIRHYTDDPDFPFASGDEMPTSGPDLFNWRKNNSNLTYTGSFDVAGPFPAYWHPGDDSDYQRYVNCTPAPNPMTPCKDLLPEWWLRGLVWLYVLVTLSANAVVVVVIVVSQPKNLTRTSRFFVCFLAIADFLLGLYLAILAIVDAATIGEYSLHALTWRVSTGCEAAGFFAIFGSTLSVFTLTIITAERLIVIRLSSSGRWKMTIRKAGICMLVGVLFSLFVAILPLVGVSSYTRVGVCLPFAVDNAASLAYVTFLLVFPMLALILIGVAYFCIYRRYTRTQSVMNPGEKRLAFRMALLVTFNCICWVPVSVIGLLTLYGPDSIFASSFESEPGKISLFVAKILVVIFFPFNAVVDPFFYAISTPHFRRDLKHWVKKLRTRIQMLHISRGVGGGTISSLRRPSLSSGPRVVGAAPTPNRGHAVIPMATLNSRHHGNVLRSQRSSTRPSHPTSPMDSSNFQKALAFRHYSAARRPSCQTNATFIGTNSVNSSPSNPEGNVSSSSGSYTGRGHLAAATTAAVSDNSSTGTFNHVYGVTLVDMHQHQQHQQQHCDATPTPPTTRATVVRFSQPDQFMLRETSV